MKLLLTGGTGFFGRALLRNHIGHKYRRAEPASIHILSRDPKHFLAVFPEFSNQADLQFLQGDICQAETLPHGEKYSHVLHAATDSTVGPRMQALDLYRQIVDGTRNLLDLATQCGAQRFLLTSSGAVYGPQPVDLAAFPETWLGGPNSMHPGQAYGMGKRAAEHLCALYTETYGLETVIARCFAFVGPDLPLDVHFAIGNFIRDALWADAIQVHGDGTPLRSYMDQNDLSHWLFTLLDRGRSGQAYNVGSPQAISIAALAELVRDTLAPGKPVLISGQSTPQYQRNLYIPDVHKACTELGLELQIPLREAIALTGAVHVAKTMGTKLQ